MKKIKILLSIMLSFALSLCLFAPAVDRMGGDFDLAVIVSIVVVAGSVLFMLSKQSKDVLMMSCAALSKDLTADCNNPLTAGTHEEMLLINPADIASIVFDTTNNLLVTDLTLKTGARAYAWVGIKNSNAPSVSMTEGEYQNNFVHQIDGLIFETDFETDKVLNDLAIGNAPLIALIHKRDHAKSGKRAFRIFGYGSNLYLRALTQTVNDTTNLGAWVFTLQTLDTGNGSVPLAFYDTDYATTLTAYEALKVVAT